MKTTMERDENGNLTKSQVEKLQNVDDIILQFKHFMDLPFFGQKRIDEFIEILLEAGWGIKYITKYISSATKISNYSKNAYIKERMEGSKLGMASMSNAR